MKDGHFGRIEDGEEIVIYIARPTPTHPRIKCGASSSDGLPALGYPAPIKRRDCGEHSVQRQGWKGAALLSLFSLFFCLFILCSPEEGVNTPLKNGYGGFIASSHNPEEFSHINQFIG